MKIPKIISLLTLSVLPILSTDAKTLKVAAVQMQLDIGNVDANLQKTEKFAREAFEKGADLVVLPEFFTTPAAILSYDDRIVESIRPLEGEPMDLLLRLSREYDGIIGGSYLALHEGEVYNSFVLVFPDGTYFVHNKDYPSFSENCYYTRGNDIGLFDTPIGRIGLVSCLEFGRTGTANRIFDQVDLVLGASCWPRNPNSDSNNRLPEIAIFARLVGVPVIHSNHVGDFIANAWFEAPEKVTWSFVGETQIIQGNGDVTQRLSYQDGEGIVLEEINLGKIEGPIEPIPERFWIKDNYNKVGELWKSSLTGPFRDYYLNETLPSVLETWNSEQQ